MPKGNKGGSTSVGQEVSYEQSNVTFISSYKHIIYAAIVMFLAVYSYVIYGEMHKTNILDLTNASADVLKDALFLADDANPSIFQCAKRETPKTSKAGKASDDKSKQNKNSSDIFTVSPMFEELFKSQGSKYTFAKLNCYQILPSGKNIFDRFALDKKSLPVVFGNAPWLSKPIQAKGASLNSAIGLAAFFEKEIATPRATSISDDSYLHSFCKFTTKKTADVNNTKTATGDNNGKDKDDKSNTTCIVLLKGTLHSNSHTETEEQLIRKYPKQRFAVIDATKYRLSFERPQDYPATSFGYRLIVLRNGTHFKPMIDRPFTMENAEEFITSTMELPLSEFYLDKSQTSTNRVKMIKANSPFFKRNVKGKDEDEDDNDIEDSEPTTADSSKSEKSKSPRKENKGSSSKTTNNKESSQKKESTTSKAPESKKESEKEPVVLSDEELAAARQRERERLARERMQDRDDIIFDETPEDVEGVAGSESSQSDQSSDEDFIEL